MRKTPLIWTLTFLLLMSIGTAPPTTHEVRGTVYHSDGSYALGGMHMSANVSVTPDFVYTRTNAFGPPPVDAGYSVFVLGEDADAVVMIAWNDTHYGVNGSQVLLSGPTFVDVTIDTTRFSETNVTVNTPGNNSWYEKGEEFEISASVGVIGNDGDFCAATLTFTNDTVLNISIDQNLTLNIGNMSRGTFATVSWNVSANETGSANFTVAANCTSDGFGLQNVDSHMVPNATVNDTIGPNITLIAPSNLSSITISADPTIFRYNVTDVSFLYNCTLVLNDQHNASNATMSSSITQEFAVVLPEGGYAWYVNCTDNSTNRNYAISDYYNVTIIALEAPTVFDILIDSSIDLTAGDDTLVYCNATVYDPNNSSDILSVNSTLYWEFTTEDAPDDNNDHYSNETCVQTSFTEFYANYTCGFGIEYYANNGTWVCNISATDTSFTSGSNLSNGTINDLLAIEITPIEINYGELYPGTNSSTSVEVNMTNAGNLNFNVSVDGYAVTDGDNLSMVCEKGSINMSYERYSLNSTELYYDMINLTDNATQFVNLTLGQRTNDTTYKNDRNQSYWKMGVPTGINGQCNGTVRFAAVAI